MQSLISKFSPSIRDDTPDVEYDGEGQGKVP